MVEDEACRLAERIATLAQDAGLSVGAAESLTGGQVSAALAAVPGASQWFRGAVVAYASEVKFRVLGVPQGPVVTRRAAEGMAAGARRLLDADVTASVTGAGGPEPQDGAEPGTVWVALADKRGVRAEELRLDGGPEDVCRDAARAVLRMLAEHLAEQS